MYGRSKLNLGITLMNVFKQYSMITWCTAISPTIKKKVSYQQKVFYEENDAGLDMWHLLWKIGMKRRVFPHHIWRVWLTRFLKWRRTERGRGEKNKKHVYSHSAGCFLGWFDWLSSKDCINFKCKHTEIQNFVYLGHEKSNHLLHRLFN